MKFKKIIDLTGSPIKDNDKEKADTLLDIKLSEKYGFSVWVVSLDFIKDLPYLNYEYKTVGYLTVKCKLKKKK